jgi:hypothetical protein
MRRLLVALGVLVLLAVVADRGSKYLVENTLADHIESKESVTGVDVTIGGFPFLTQVIQNHFDEVDVTMPRIDAATSAGTVEVEDVRISLRDVETAHRFTKAVAATARGSGFVPYSAFDQFDPIQVQYGGTTTDGSGYLLVSAPSLGSQTVRVTPSAANGLSLDLDALSAVSAALPRQLASFVRRAHEFAGVPGGITIKSVQATEDGLRVTLVGRDLAIAS